MPPNAKVLVVDDSASCRHVVSSKLRSLAADVTETADGAQALQLLLAEPFDLVIIDLEMPKLDGFSLLGCIRGHPKTRHMPTIVLTSNESRHALEQALSAGATSYLTKPLNWVAFGDHIKHLLELARGRPHDRWATHAAS